MLSYPDTCRAALAIAKVSRTHREAIATIIDRNLADDEPDADALIYEGENLEDKDRLTR